MLDEPWRMTEQHGMIAPLLAAVEVAQQELAEKARQVVRDACD